MHVTMRKTCCFMKVDLLFLLRKSIQNQVRQDESGILGLFPNGDAKPDERRALLITTATITY